MTTRLQPTSKALTVNGLRIHYLGASPMRRPWSASTAIPAAPSRSTRSLVTCRIGIASSSPMCAITGKVPGRATAPISTAIRPATSPLLSTGSVSPPTPRDVRMNNRYRSILMDENTPSREN
jgi:hypothetical protein